MVLNENGDFLEDASVYFIMTGNYKVQSLMYEMKHKRKQMDSAEENPGSIDPNSA